MRAFLCVLDSLGVGAAPDASAYGDASANTLGHVALACARGNGDRDGLRRGPLFIPNLASLGLGLACAEASGREWPIAAPDHIAGRYGCAAEVSSGKDTPSGHWELSGLPVLFDWHYFPDQDRCFPPDLVADIVKQGDVPGVLGERHASGTVIIEELGSEHIRTGKPILYTSGDSVIQIAAHEEHFGVDRLYRLCELVRELVTGMSVGRIIARPFTGDEQTGFVRTLNRHDYVTPPHGDTVLDVAVAAGRDVVAVGKVADIFAHRGITRTVKGGDNAAVGSAVSREIASAPSGSLVFANFNDFDTLHGHRRDVAGYAAALEAFDRQLAGFRSELRDDDLLVLTADHGCDPTQPGSDHTREFVPVLFTGPGVVPGSVGRRATFADVGQSIAAHLALPPLQYGTSCLTS